MFLTCWCCLAGCGKRDPAHIVPGDGRLLKWSGQTAESPKKVVFIQSKVETDDPNGLTLPQAEKFFDTKVKNINYLGTELIGAPLFDRSELWFYSYYPNQELPEIMEDLATAIAHNRHFDNSLIYMLGYSQGGVELYLLDQRHPGVVAGGDVLGAPVLSAPIVHSDIRQAAIASVFPVLAPALSAVFEKFAGELVYLQAEYPETGAPNGDLQFIAGRIDPPADDVFRRNFNLLDAAAAMMDALRGNAHSERQFTELGSYLMSHSRWGVGSRDDRTGDGIVPVSSATLNGTVPHIVMDDYDHLDLLSDKGDLVLDRIIAEHIVAVLDLQPGWVETDLPETPEIIELDESARSALEWGKFAYVAGSDNRVWVADEDWRETWRMPISGVHAWPRFSPSGSSLVFGLATSSYSDVYIWRGDWAGPVSFDGDSQLADFSPDGNWLVYQAGNQLVIHNLGSHRRHVVVEGVDLVMPPVWTVEGLLGQIYLAQRTADNELDIYRTSPRSRDVALADTTLVESGCRCLFVVRGLVPGIVALGEPVVAGQSVSQKITAISGLTSMRLDLTITTSGGAYDELSGQGWSDLMLALARDFDVVEIAFDAQYGHLYLNDRAGPYPGLYLLDINQWFNNPEAQWEDIFYPIDWMEDISQLDINSPKR